ncbi:TonB-dependent receptor plug domain-containing protein [Flavobacterium nitrogenifigens]|uniref:Iron complex outermembrane recepter protein n=1 Tax=Flavobacterium nitrogenifigens TaxID=1617283 RepID=A0A521D5D3_9FLAO|nr:TonB-dependent receptor [Flavobacterium nitrogenifigens]KAF2337294.1 TonB-dependent receptor [Flavobacterium nitrogenifigens]SMO66904.1 iron complex outermembrane recepter protein [Flavobacterium nitrogenifigens]
MKPKLLIFLLFPLIGFSQQNNPKAPDSLKISNVFNLGEVIITNHQNKDTLNRITSKAMESQNKMEVSKALNMLPGVSLTASGPRNESMVSVRGFDLRQVPVYMDGIPVYVPYDGYVDLARFTTFDLAAVDVSKGFSSVLYGPNSLGGAINLVSRKPSKKLEFDGSLGMINENGYRGNVNIGSNLGKFYVQGGFSYLDRNSYRMSSNFIPTANENGGQRDNSYRTDQKISFKVGWTPTEKSEYAIGYINQQGEKGNPVYTGNDPLNTLLLKPRYWQWPNWDKESFYFISNSAFDDKNSFKTRLYFDRFKNTLDSYDDATYSTQTKPYAFESIYNDYTFGGNLEYNTKIIPKNDLKIAFHFKEDVHRENNLGEPVRHFIDNTVLIGIEDVYKVSSKFTVIPGVSYNIRKNNEAEDYNSTTKVISDYPDAGASDAFNAQVGFFYQLNNQQKLGATVSQKTRFATIKDRYSYRMGTAIPNPDLKPEKAINYELNYTANLFEKITFQTALFYSSLSDAILSVSNVEPGKSQMQNFGEADYKGVEAQLNYAVLENLSLNLNYTYIERKNITNPNIHFTDVPNTKVMGTLEYSPIKILRLIANAEFNSPRFSTSYGARVPDYTLLNLYGSGKISKNFSLDAGVNNIFDRNYSLVEGYPEEGRNFFVTLRFFSFN